MKVLKFSLYTAISMMSMSFSGYGFMPLEIPKSNTWHWAEYEIDQTAFPMIPYEQDIKDFPPPITEDEGDPDILEQYYEAAATAYRHWGDEQKDIVKFYMAKVHQQQERLLVRNARFAKSYGVLKIDPFTQAQAHSVNYYKKACTLAHFNAQLAEKKAEFYQEIADIWKILKSGHL